MPVHHGANSIWLLVAPPDGRVRVCVHLCLCVPEQGQHASELRVALPIDASGHSHSPTASPELKVRPFPPCESGFCRVLVSSLVRSGQVLR